MATEPEFSEPRPDQARFRFPKAAHLFRAREFQAVRETGVLQRGKYLFVSVLKGKETGLARFGIVTSRRVGPAVQRNAVRRRLREIIRLSRGRMIEGGWFIVTARPGSAQASYLQLEEEWKKSVGRLKAWREMPTPLPAEPGRSPTLPTDGTGKSGAPPG